MEKASKIAFRKSEQKSIRGGLTGVYPRFSKSLFCSLFYTLEDLKWDDF
jgi:hypothetical protein